MKKILNFLHWTLTLFLLLSLYLTPGVQNTVIAQQAATTFSNLRVTNFFREQPRTAITITNGGTLTPTGGYQRITAAGAVGASLATRPAGSLLHLVNVGAQTITFTETATLISAGNIVLGAGDTATLISDGTNWTQLAGSNN